MKTIPLFDKNGFLKEFIAVVLDCRQVEDGWQVMLDQTGFFPEVPEIIKASISSGYRAA